MHVFYASNSFTTNSLASTTVKNVHPNRWQNMQSKVKPSEADEWQTGHPNSTHTMSSFIFSNDAISSFNLYRMKRVCRGWRGARGCT